MTKNSYDFFPLISKPSRFFHCGVSLWETQTDPNNNSMMIFSF